MKQNWESGYHCETCSSLENCKILVLKGVLLPCQPEQDWPIEPISSDPKDPAVAVYFILKNEPKVLACDKWTRVEANLWAIGKHIEALRGQQRWGVGTLDQAFAGYDALPAPKTAWWEVLVVPRSASKEMAQAAYRALAKQHHPDTGGSNEKFLKIQQAWDEARKEHGW